MKNLLLIYLLLSFNILFAQQLQSIAFEDNYQNIHTNISELKKSILNEDGSSYLFGNQDANYSTMDVFVIKLDQNLDTLWTHLISTPEGKSIDDFQNAEVDSNGDIYVYSANLINANYYETDSKHFVTKLNSDGVMIFRKSLEIVSQENNQPGSYITTNYSFLFSHINNDDQFVLIYSAHSPSPTISFFYFYPNNTTDLVHRDDLLVYDPAVDSYGYYVNFFYEKGAYYYTSGVRQNTTGNPQENRLNKMLDEGFLTLDVTPYVGTQQVFLVPETKNLKSNQSGNTLFFNFDHSGYTYSFRNIITTDSLQFLGYYNDTLKKNKYDSSYILPNGNMRIFSRSTPYNSPNTPPKLTETVIDINGIVIKDSIYQDFTAVDLINIDQNTNAIVQQSSISLVDNDWNLINQFNNINPYHISSIRKFNSDFYIYSNERGFLSSLFQSIIDNVVTHTYKLEDNTLPYQHFSYQGDGTAHCLYSGTSTLLSDGSRIIFYHCNKGSSITSLGILNEETVFVKKVDSDLNTIWDNELPLPYNSNIAKDDNDTMFFGSQTPNYWIIAPYPMYYFLNKMTPDGNIEYTIPSSRFNNIFIKDGYLYTTKNSLESGTIIRKHDKDTGSLIEQFSIPDGNFINQFIDTNDDIYLYFKRDNYTPISNKSIVVYKNFVQVANVFLGENFNTVSANIVDPISKSLFFSAHKNGTNIFKIFKINIDGTKSFIITPEQYRAMQELNNSVYFKNSHQLFQINKSNLDILNEMPFGYGSMTKKDNMLIRLSETSALKVYDEDLNHTGTFQLEDSDYSYLYFTDDNKIHQFQQVSKRYLTQDLPRWMINRIKLYDFNEVALSSEDFSEYSQNKKVKIYPNPSSEFINIEIENTKINFIEIFTTQGKFIETQNQQPLNISHLPQAVYLLRIHTVDSKPFYAKIIKK